MIHFRQMTPEDAAGVELVEKASFAVPWSRQAFWQEAASERAYYLLVLEDEKIIGYAGTWIILDEAQITNVAIAPEYRGRGIGSQLMAALIQAVKARGATAMTLEVRPSNAAAIAYVEIVHPGGKLFGVGINTNIVTASLEAIVSAANRVIALRG